jgi:hypothetical protein
VEGEEEVGKAVEVGVGVEQEREVPEVVLLILVCPLPSPFLPSPPCLGVPCLRFPVPLLSSSPFNRILVSTSPKRAWNSTVS